MKRFLHALAPWLVVAIFVGAVWLLYRELKHITTTTSSKACDRYLPAGSGRPWP